VHRSGRTDVECTPLLPPSYSKLNNGKRRRVQSKALLWDSRPALHLDTAWHVRMTFFFGGLFLSNSAFPLAGILLEMACDCGPKARLGLSRYLYSSSCHSKYTQVTYNEFELVTDLCIKMTVSKSDPFPPLHPFLDLWKISHHQHALASTTHVWSIPWNILWVSHTTLTFICDFKKKRMPLLALYFLSFRQAHRCSTGKVKSHSPCC
jgi:hypothetical protein